MIKGKRSIRLKSLSALAVLVCMTAMFAVFSISNSAGAAPRSAETELQRFGIRGTVACSTYGNNPDGFMCNVNGKAYIVDLKNNRIASIENPGDFFGLLKWQNEQKRDDTIIAQFLIRNDTFDNDRAFGEWRGSHHFFPIYILTTYDKNGKRIIDGKVSSGEGPSPSHYQGYLKEQKNNDLAALFISEVFPYIESAGIPASAPAKWPGSHPGTITGNNVDIRTGPDSGYKSLGVFFQGDYVTLLNRITAADGETWYEVKYYNRQYGWIQGWVNGNYIKEND